MVELQLYRWGITGGYGLLYPWLRKKYAPGFEERRGRYDPSLKSLCSASSLWVHAVSVGEVQSAVPLVNAMRETSLGEEPLIFSTITPTGRHMAEMSLASKVDRFFYYPWDVPRIVKNSLKALNPRLYITLETEIWPTLLEELHGRNVPAFLVNGRFSEKTLRRGLRFNKLYGHVLNRFEGLYLRNEEERERALALGVAPKKIRVTGENKAQAVWERKRKMPPHLLSPPEGPSIFVGGSTHPGEEDVLLQAYGKLTLERPGRLILAPRHPERAGDVVRQSMAKGFKTCLYSEGSVFSGPWDVLVVDTIGILFFLYSWAQGVFVGGSLVPKGGQNLIEPAAWGVPVVHGPHMEDFLVIARDLGALGCARTVSTVEELAWAWEDCLENPRRKEEAFKGVGYVQSLGGAAAKAWEEIHARLQEGF